MVFKLLLFFVVAFDIMAVVNLCSFSAVYVICVCFNATYNQGITLDKILFDHYHQSLYSIKAPQRKYCRFNQETILHYNKTEAVQISTQSN